jgi:hypothetical protein
MSFKERLIGYLPESSQRKIIYQTKKANALFALSVAISHEPREKIKFRPESFMPASVKALQIRRSMDQEVALLSDDRYYKRSTNVVIGELDVSMGESEDAQRKRLEIAENIRAKAQDQYPRSIDESIKKPTGREFTACIKIGDIKVLVKLPPLKNGAIYPGVEIEIVQPNGLNRKAQTYDTFDAALDVIKIMGNSPVLRPKNLRLLNKC